MDNPFSQQKVSYKLYFNTFYKYVDRFESFFPEDIPGLSSFEIKREETETDEDDIWCIEAYLATKPLKTGIIQSLKNFANRYKLEIIGDIEFLKIDDKDWVLEYQKQLVPLYIGRFFVSTSKHLKECPLESLPIIIEASRAFGTGEHATTAGCLEALETLTNFNFKTILDIGTGSGILSFAATKLWPEAKVLACDIEAKAIEAAKINQKFNKSNIHFYQNSSQDFCLSSKQDKSFDLIISNILAQPLKELSRPIRELLQHDSRLILAGFLDYQMDEVINAYRRVELELEATINKKNWVTFIMKVKE